MNRLNKTLVYLSGPIENASDNGVSWREVITSKLKPYGIGILNPCDKPSCMYCEDSTTRELPVSCRNNEDWDKVISIMKPICGIDLRMVDIAHFIIMYLDPNVHTCGTYHEIFVAIQQKKPVLIMCEGGKKKMPFWLFGVIPITMMFDTWDELIAYIDHINKDDNVDDCNRWRFFDFAKIFS